MNQGNDSRTFRWAEFAKGKLEIIELTKDHDRTLSAMRNCPVDTELNSPFSDLGHETSS
jgi:hypothetical protein